jgi:hypothetical protein
MFGVCSYLPKQKCLPVKGGIMMLLGLSAGGQNVVLHNGYRIQDESSLVKGFLKKLADCRGCWKITDQADS